MNYLANWKTTALGAGAFFTALGHLLTALASGDTSTLFSDVPLMMAALSAIFAKDA